jgi:hypothetical protein
LEIGKKYLIGFKTSDDTIDSNSWALRIYCKKDSTTVLSTTDSRGSDVTFTVPEETVGANVQFIIVSGTVLNKVVIKPMIRLASVKDDTYVPYAPTNAKLNEEKMSYTDNGILGAKNLLPYPYTNASTKEMGGITWTVNADGSITASGTSTERSYFMLQHNSAKWKISKGTYILSQSGLPADVSIVCGYWDSPGSYYANGPQVTRTKPEAEFEVTDILATKIFEQYIDIPATNVGKTFNFTVYPMIRLATYHDSTYQPYAMTNRELTEKVSKLDSSWVDITSDASAYVSSGYIKYKKIGQLVIVKMWDVIFNGDGSGNVLSNNLPTCDDNATNRIFRDQREGLGALYMNNNSKNLYCHHANPSGDTTQTKWYGEMIYTTSD